MDVPVVLTAEDRKTLEHCRILAGALVDGHLEIDVFGCPPISLIQDEIDALLSKVRAAAGIGVLERRAMNLADADVVAIGSRRVW